MCNYFSCIINRKREVLWLKNSSSHEDIIEHFKLDDSKLEDRDFVRIEILPNNSQYPTRDEKDWTLRVDEEYTLPNWFKKTRVQATAKCWFAWKESVACQLVLGDEERTFKNRDHVYAYGAAKVKAFGNVSVRAFDNVTVEASGNVTVEAFGNVSVRAFDNVTVRAYSSANKVQVLSSTATVIYQDKVYVRKDAKVQKVVEGEFIAANYPPP